MEHTHSIFSKSNLLHKFTALTTHLSWFIAALSVSSNIPLKNPFLICICFFCTGYWLLKCLRMDLRDRDVIVLGLALSPLISLIWLINSKIAGMSSQLSWLSLAVFSAIGHLCSQQTHNPTSNSEKALDRQSMNAILYAMLVIAIVLLPLFNKYCMTQRDHGFAHIAIAYSAVDTGLPPKSPFFYGKHVSYYYLGHFLLGSLSDASAIALPYCFGAISFFSLVLLLLSLTKLTRAYEGNRKKFPYLTSLLVLFAPYSIARCFSLLFHNTFNLPAKLPIFEPGLELFHKFTQVNFNQVGIAFASLAFAGLISTFHDKNRLNAHIILTGLVGLTVFYPIYLPVMIIISIWATLLDLYRVKMSHSGKAVNGLWRSNQTLLIKWAFILITTVVVGAICAWSISLDRTDVLTFRINHSQLMLEFLLLRFIPLAPLLLLAVSNWHIKITQPIQQFKTYYSIGTMLLIFPFCFAVEVTNFTTSYKFCYLIHILLGTIAACRICELIATIRTPLIRKVIFFTLTFFLLLPILQKQMLMLRLPRQSTVRLSISWPFLQYLGPKVINQNLFLWIRNNTPADSLFIDSENLIPVFTRRHLLLAEGVNMNVAGRNRDRAFKHDFHRDYYMRQSGYSKKDLLWLITVKKAFLNLNRPSNLHINLTDHTRIAALRYTQKIPQPIYIVHRAGLPSIHPILLNKLSIAKIFADITVYKLQSH